MAKTQWADGSFITPAGRILEFGNDAASGHNHLGLDADGSAPIVWSLDTISVDVTSTYFTTPVNSTWTYFKPEGLDIVVLKIPEIIGVHASSDELQFAPNSGNWPVVIIPTGNEQYPIVSLRKQDAAAGELRLGHLIIPTSTSTNIIAKITDNNAVLIAAGFGTAGVPGHEKGIEAQEVIYHRA